jgi:predicted nuclease of restriction endonuclease-like (RecB) superfamily
LLSTFWVLYVASFFLDGAIETKLHERQGKSINNFDITLPPYDSDMANQIFKDPYCLIFSALTILVEKQN